jgi:RHS repeat-associated protein
VPPTLTQYDGDGNIVLVTAPDGSFTQTHYNSKGLQDYEIDAVGNRTDYAYDSQGRLTTVTQAAVVNPATGLSVRPVTTYSYDQYGDRTSIIDANGHVTQFTFDAFGHQLTRTLPAVNGTSVTETSTYNTFGDLYTHTDFNGNVTKEIYDYEQTGGTGLGRLMEVDYFKAGSSTVETKVTYHYDSLGRQDKVFETTAGVTRETDTSYDAEGHITQVTAPEGTINSAYSDLTGLETKVWTTQTEVDYGYDASGRLQTVTEAKRAGTVLSTPTVGTYTFDSNTGNTLTLTITSGASTLETTSYGYDPSRHWLVSVTNKDGSGNTLSSFTYTRRVDGQINQETESVQQPDGSTKSGTETYVYDGLDRLTQESWTGTGADSYTNQYTLDLVGNRISETVTGAGAKSVVNTYDARDELLTTQTTTSGTSVTTSFGYDKNGSQITIMTAGVLQQTLVYDARGRLVQVNNGSGAVVESILYTADGARAAVTQGGVTTSYLVDQQSLTGYSEILDEYQSGALVNSYVYGSSLNPVSQNANAGGTGLSSILLLGDVHSGVRQAYKSGSPVILAQRFDAFGNTVATMTASGNPFTTVIGYRGQRVDHVLGQYDLRARTYDPQSGRFTRIDPADGTYNDLLQAMRYGYTGANPVGAMDPSRMDDDLAGDLVGLGVSISASLGCPGVQAYRSLLGAPGIILGAAVGFYGGFISGYADALAADPLVSEQELLSEAFVSGIIGAIEGALVFAYMNGLGRSGKSCFQAGTPLLTPDGSKPIEEFKPGDLVLSRDENDPAGPVQAKVVHEVFRTESRLMYLTAGGRRIGTTSAHPFYVQGRGWMHAGDLTIGDVLVGKDGMTTLVEAKETGACAVVYNLRVEGYHTYFVGAADWGFSLWAHNLCEFQIEPYGLFRGSGTKLEGHELLQADWLKNHGWIRRRGQGAIGAGNPAMALSKDNHKTVNANQRALGL